MAQAGGTIREWPIAASNYTVENVRTAFKLDKSETQEFLGSDAVTGAVSELAVWKTKYTTAQSPSLAQVTARNIVPAGQQPVGKLQEYMTILEGLVDGARDFFALGPNDPVVLNDIRDAHRVLGCAARQAVRSGGTPAATPRRPAAPAPASVAATPRASRRPATTGTSSAAATPSASATPSTATSSVRRPATQASSSSQASPSTRAGAGRSTGPRSTSRSRTLARRDAVPAARTAPSQRDSGSPPRSRIRVEDRGDPEPVIEKRVDLQVLWENHPPEVPKRSTRKFQANIQRRLQYWGDFEHWVETEYGLAFLGLQVAQYLASTTPSPQPKFDLDDYELTEADWEFAVSNASRMGVLMVSFTTAPRAPAPAPAPPHVSVSESEAKDGSNDTADNEEERARERERTDQSLRRSTSRVANLRIGDEAPRDQDIEMSDRPRETLSPARNPARQSGLAARTPTPIEQDPMEEDQAEDQGGVEEEEGKGKGKGKQKEEEGEEGEEEGEDNPPADSSEDSVSSRSEPDIGEIVKPTRRLTGIGRGGPSSQVKPRPKVLINTDANFDLIAGAPFDKIVLGETGDDSRKEGPDDADGDTASVEWLHRILDNEIFQRENLQESFATLGIDPVTRAFPLIKPPFKFMDHQIIGINWMKEKEEGLACGGLLADDCGTGKTMTLLGLLCIQAHEYEVRRVKQNLTTEFYQQALETYERSKKEGTLKEGDMKPRNPDKIFMGPTLIICPVPMISEWQEAIRSNTLLTPILHYGQSFFDRRAWHQINSASKFPWRHVIITTKETLMKRWNTKDYRGQRFWGTEDLPLHRLVLDEAHRFRVSGAPPGGVISPTTGLLSRSDPNNAMAVWAKHLDSLNPEAKWMLTATPLVSTMSDLRWVCRFLQRPEWLSDNLPPDTFANKHDIELGAWFQNPDRPSEDGNNLDATFTPVADPFRDHRAHGSYVHCTIKAWNTFIWGNLNNASKLQHLQRTGTITPNQREHLSDCLRIVGGYAQEILRTLILRRSMVSRIPFRVGKPIIDIPVMKTVTTRLQFADDGSKDVYSFLVDNYARMRASFGRSAADGQQAPIPGHKFGPRWRYIRLVSLSPLLAYASFAEEFSTENLFSKDQADQGHPHRLKVKSLLTKFREQIPDKGTDFYPESMANMSDEDMVRAMEFCSPKLGRLKDRLHELVTLGGKKVILWVYWPLSQWLVQEYVRLLGITCFAVYSGLSNKNRDKIKDSFNKTKDIDVLVLSYLCSNEGINLHYQCSDTIMVEQGLSYASEHQAWSRVRRIGQKEEQNTERLVNLQTIDTLIEKAQRERQSPMLYAWGIMESLGGTADTDEVFDTLIGKTPPAVLRDQIIGRGGPDELEIDD